MQWHFSCCNEIMLFAPEIPSKEPIVNQKVCKRMRHQLSVFGNNNIGMT